MYNLDEYDRIIAVGNRHGHVEVIEQDTELMTLTEEEKHFIRGTLFGIGIGIGLMLLMMVIMACI